MNGTTQTPTLIQCHGSPGEMGEAQGSAAREKIRCARDDLKRLEAFRMRCPWWATFNLFRRVAEGQTKRMLAPNLRRAYPGALDRLNGIAKGAGVSIGSVCLFNALEPLMSDASECVACLGACSAVAIRGKRSATGEPVIARNFDYLSLVQPYYVLRDSRPKGARRTLDFVTAPLVGTIDGVNDAGLAITYNYGFTVDKPDKDSAPISVIIAEALDRCETAAEAVRLIESRKRWGGALLMLADAGGDILSLELSATRCSVRRPDSGEDVLFHTNVYQSDSMQPVQVDRQATFTNKAPTPLRGRRLLASAEQRHDRFHTLFAGDSPLSPDELAGLLADHGPEGIGTDSTVCMHGDYWNTTACLQLMPRSRGLRVAFSSACQAKYQDFSL